MTDHRSVTSRVQLELLEVRTAQRDRALDLLEQLERVITGIGGYMTTADQIPLFEAKALLVESGKRKREPRPPWVDRMPAEDPERGPKRVGCDESDTNWPCADCGPRGLTLCVQYPRCRCGQIDQRRNRGTGGVI